MPDFTTLLAAVFLQAGVPAIEAESDANTAPGGEAAHVRLSPAGETHWRAEFSWTSPVDQLALIRSSSGLRAERVRLLDEAFEIVTTEEGDIIRRTDGGAFTQVAVLEPVAIEVASGGYLPFAQFGDGGLLLHTGRFHACAGPCPLDETGDEGPWTFEIDPGAEERMIVNGAVVTGVHRFTDTANGTKVYVGDGAIIEGDGMVAVVDTHLPVEVTQHLEALFPELLTYFSAQLGALDDTVMLFASYNVPGDVNGSTVKGGTLPSQVFMHFEGSTMAAFAESEEFPSFLSWFFAHEAAHLFQDHSHSRYDRADSWIHEGAADAKAYLALRDLGAAPADYLQHRLERAHGACSQALADGPLRGAEERGAPFLTYYECGLILHLAVDAAARRETGQSFYEVWRSFTQATRAGAPWDVTGFSAVVEAAAGPATARFVEAVVLRPLDDPARTLADGLAASGFEAPLAPLQAE